MEQSVHIRWAECQQMLRDNLTSTVYSTWFAPLQALSFDNGTLVLQAKSQFVVEYIEENYLSLLSKVLFRVFGEHTRLEYRVLIDSQNDAGVYIPSDVTSAPVTAPVIAMSPTTAKNNTFDSQLNPSYTFDTFVQGTANRIARAAGLAIADRPGNNIFNPLFVYGGSGVGKTHLANAIGNEVLRQYPAKRVLYVSANTFQLQYQDAVAHNTVPDFLLFYQSIDVLIVDDVQYFAGKRGTQDTFFHIFNYLQQSQKQIVLTCDKQPKDLHDLEDRLLTRFKWRLSIEMTKPDFTLRKDILLRKMYRDGITLPDEVVDFIANNVRDNVRDLEGVLASLLAYSTLADNHIDLALAEQVVGRIVEIKPHEVHIAEIAETVCEECGVAKEALLNKGRQQDVAKARQLSMFLAKKYTALSLAEIGRYFGNRTHATVLHAIDSVNEMLQSDIAMQRALTKIERSLAR